MASFNHFKFESSGKKSNIDVKFSFDKDDSNANRGVSEVSRYNGMRANANSQGQFTSGGYERGRSRNSPTQDDSESDCDTDMEGLYADTKAGLNGYRALKSDAAKLINMFMSQHNGKVKDKYLHKKLDGYEGNYGKEKTKYFRKNKITKSISKSIVKRPEHYLVYGLGSYFDGEQVDSQEQMSSERNRYATFYNYSGNGNPRDLASNAFYHDHNEGPDATRCFECRVSNSRWTENDHVLSVHRRLAPNCPFLNRYNSTTRQNESSTFRTNTERQTEPTSTTSGVSEAQIYINVANAKFTRKYGNQEQKPEAVNLQGSSQAFGRSGQSNAETQVKQVPESNQMCSTQESGYNTDSEFRLALNSRGSATQPLPNMMRNTPSASASALQMRSPFDVTLNNPRHLDKYSLDARTSSYEQWQEYGIKSPRELAEAGFFYAGVADFVRCFCCDGGLRNWSAEDDPMEEHARWFPACEYIRSIKGERYVVEVQRRTCGNTAGNQGQNNGRAEMINDTTALEVVNDMLAMGISVDHAREAVLGVRPQTGGYQVTLDEALNWYLDNVQSLESANTAVAVPAQTIETTNSQSSLACAASSTRTSTDNPEAMSLKAENQRLKEANMCKMCMEQPMNIVFLPCGHLLYCETCAIQIKQCPTCRERVMGTVKTFMPV